VKEELVYCVVDIAKSCLDVAVGNEKGRLANDAPWSSPVDQLAQRGWRPGTGDCQPNGGYEQALVQSLARTRIRISLVQANRVRQFARAAGILAETDRIDARVLCGFGAAMRPTLSASNLQKQLRELESQRRHLTHLLVMEQNRDARLSDLSIRTLNRRLIQQIQRQIEKVDLLIKNQIERSQERSAKAQKLTAITEWEHHCCFAHGPNARAWAIQPSRSCSAGWSRALNRDSGKLRGKRTIYCGRWPVRRGLYISAMVMARALNSALKPELTCA
jgi:transposase